MDPRERLSELVRERGNSLAALSRMLGRNSTYLQQFITKGSPRKLEEAAVLAPVFRDAEGILRVLLLLRFCITASL